MGLRCAWILSRKANVFWGTVLLVLGVICITIGALIPRVVDDQINKTVLNVVVVDGYDADAFDSWRTTTLSTSPHYYKNYYFFNITNPTEVQNGGYPVLEEVGPYKYRYFTEKVDVKFSTDGGEVDFKLYEHFHWSDSDNPGKSRNDTVYTINPAYVAILSQVGATTNRWEFALKVAFFSNYLSNLYRSMATTMVNFVVSNTRVSLGARVDVTTAPWFSSVPEATAKNMANSSYLYSFPSQLGGPLWYKALAGDATSTGYLARAWSLPPATVLTIATWLNQTTSQLVPAAIMATFKVSQEDLPFLQWNSLGVLGGRLKDLVDSVAAAAGAPAPTVPPFAEFSAFSIYAMNNSTTPFTTALVKEFFLGNAAHQGFQQTSTVTQFLFLLSTNNTAAIQGLFGWNAEQANFFIRYFNFVFENTIDAIIKRGNGGLFATNKVEELLFRYNDPLTALMAPQKNPIKVTVNNTSVEDAQLRSPTTLSTGGGDVNQIMRYVAWKNSTTVNAWASPEPVSAGDGTTIPPNSQSVPELTIFSQTLQRRLSITYQGNADFKGISLYEYHLKENSFENSTNNPENARYFANIDGFHNMTSTELIAGVPGIPVFFSRPHFWMVDEYFANLVSLKGFDRPGMNPNPALHSTYLRFEPTTGRSMDIALRLQVNVELDPVHFGLYHKIPGRYFLPVYWVDERSSLTDKQADTYRNSIDSAKKSSRVAQVLLLVFGVLMVVGGFALGLLALKRFRTELAASNKQPDLVL